MTPARRNLLLGCLCAVSCETVFGLSYLFTKDATGSASPLALLGWRFAVAFAALGLLPAAGAAVFAPLALVEAACAGKVRSLLRLPLENRAFLRAVLFQGVGSSVLGFVLSNAALAKIGVNRTASFIGVATVVAIVAGVSFLHEPFSAAQTAGVTLILLGVYVANAKA